MSIPNVQKAWVAVQRGTPEQALRLKTDWPVVKKLKPGEVLVKVQAAALNPVGYKFLKLLPNWFANRPHAAEYDLAGVIADENDTSYKKGDNVFGWIRGESQWRSKQGSLAEYLVVPSTDTALRPPNVSIIGASGVALTAMTALGALNEAHLEAGQILLINGASTAVGSYGIQLAKLRGAKVVAVASGKNEEYVRNLGADEFIDYTKVGPLHEYLTNNPPAVKYNVILECAAMYGPSLYTFSKPYLSPNGVYVSVGAQPNLSGWKSTLWDTLRLAAIYLPSFITGFKARFILTITKSSKENILLLQKSLEEGTVKPVVDSVHNFEDALKAYERIMTSRATGKVVVKVDNSIPDA